MERREINHKNKTMSAEKILRQEKYASLKNLVLICEAMEEYAKEVNQDKDWKRVGELANEITKIVRNETLPSKTLG